MVGTVILGSRATLRLEVTIEKIQEGKEIAKVHHMNGGSDSDLNKDLALVYFQGATALLKLYGPTITLGAASIAAIVGGQGILKRRNVALAAAYKAIETGFMEYRRRVIEEFGEEKDFQYRHGIFQEKIEDANGKKKTVLTRDASVVAPYSKWFAEGETDEWKPDIFYNLAFLRAQEHIFNQLLQARGHVFLNEVYDTLGFPRSTAGQAVGWLVENSDGDDYISFGIYDGQDGKNSKSFVHGGPDNAVLLDFNVDGPIMTKIE